MDDPYCKFCLVVRGTTFSPGTRRRELKGRDGGLYSYRWFCWTFAVAIENHGLVFVVLLSGLLDMHPHSHVPKIKKQNLSVESPSSPAAYAYAFYLVAIFHLCFCQAVTTIQGQLTSCPSAISQAAGLVALSVSDDEMQASFDIMREKV